MHKRAAASQRLVQVWAQTRMRAAADYSYSTTGSACMPHIPTESAWRPMCFPGAPHDGGFAAASQEVVLWSLGAQVDIEVLERLGGHVAR